MKLVDVNVLIYAVDGLSAHHDRARNWLERLINDGDTVALPWAVLTGFVRLTTKPQIVKAPLSVDAALDFIDGLLALPNVVVVHPTDRHASILRALLAPLGTGGNLIADAHLAALSIEYGAELTSFDRDFGRFRGVRWVEPA